MTVVPLLIQSVAAEEYHQSCRCKDHVVQINQRSCHQELRYYRVGFFTPDAALHCLFVVGGGATAGVCHSSPLINQYVRISS